MTRRLFKSFAYWELITRGIKIIICCFDAAGLDTCWQTEVFKSNSTQKALLESSLAAGPDWMSVISKNI